MERTHPEPTTQPNVNQSCCWYPCLGLRDGQFRICIPHYLESSLGWHSYISGIFPIIIKLPPFSDNSLFNLSLQPILTYNLIPSVLVLSLPKLNPSIKSILFLSLNRFILPLSSLFFNPSEFAICSLVIIYLAVNAHE